MRWHYRVRAIHGQRMLSRLLQVLETQGIQPSRIECVTHAPWATIDIVVNADEEKARRIGLLLTRIDRLPSVLWRSVNDPLIMDEDLPDIAYAIRAPRHAQPELDPLCDFWRTAPSVIMNRDSFNLPVSNHDTEVRFCWTDTTLCILFQCQYESLHLRECAPDLSVPTQRLWEHDVAEIFIAAGHSTPSRYAEFEVSPRAEWIDLQIQTPREEYPNAEPLSSGFVCEARVDSQTSQWLAMMQIPFAAILTSVPAAGTGFRMNLYRSQGNGPVELAWRPVFNESFHIPASFGSLILVD